MFARTGSVTVSCQLPGEKEMVMPGEDTPLSMTCRVGFPVESSQRFTLRDGHQTVGTGVVTKVIA